ncbi:MAG: MmgE/PrpD family protein [Deltaproteobacteria bacterium]|nr:MmgE/PrpD family protein [Deltaproteobacteria bacterium]
MQKNRSAAGDVITEVSAYIAGATETALPAGVTKRAKCHILDALAAMVSGSHLKAGQLATEYVRQQGGKKESQVASANLVTSAIQAAFANGMMAHADETDDSHTKTLVHPGSAVVPAALAMAEREGADGARFLKSVVTGYDVGCRIPLALGGLGHLLKGAGATPGIGGTFGAAAAAAALAGLNEEAVRYVLAYAAQQASGVNCWKRDEEHVLKAFVFGGMPARNGVTAAIMVQAGFSGVRDSFSGEDNFIDAFSTQPDPRLWIAGQGQDYEILHTDLKKFSVGYPIQAALDGLLKLMNRHGLRAKDVKSVIARLPQPGVQTINNRSMPDINLQHILAVTLLDGRLTFETAHAFERMSDPDVVEVKKRIQLVEEPDLTATKKTRQAVIEIVTKDGASLRELGISRGTAENPMTAEEVEEKSRELMTPVLGKERSEKLIETVWNLEGVKNMRKLRPLLFSDPIQ